MPHRLFALSLLIVALAKSASAQLDLEVEQPVLIDRFDDRIAVVARNGGTATLRSGFLDFFIAEAGGKVRLVDGYVVDLEAQGGGEVVVDGGEIGGFFSIDELGQATVNGGLYGIFVEVGAPEGEGAGLPAVLTLNGGVNQGGIFIVNAGGLLEVRGGDVNRIGGISTFIDNSAEIRFYGSDFQLDGQPLVDLPIDEVIEIAERGVTLTGRLEDGSPFTFPIASVPFGEEQAASIALGGRLSVVQLVPEPSAAVLTVLATASWGTRSSRRHTIELVPG